MTHESNSAGLLKRSSRRGSAGAREKSSASAMHDDLRALRAVVEGTARGTGQEFFQSLVRHLAEAIDVHYAVVAEFPKAPPHVRTLAFWERDRIVDNFEYDFTGPVRKSCAADWCTTQVVSRSFFLRQRRW